MILGGFTARVRVDAAAQQEYAVVTTEDGRRATCYIQSQEGKNFEVIWKDKRFAPTATIGRIKLDGVNMNAEGCGTIIRPLDGSSKSSRGYAKKSGLRVSQSTLRPFKFTSVELTDDTSSATAPDAHLGEIRLQIWTVMITSGISSPRSHMTWSSVPTNEKIHETSKKAGIHRVGFCDEVPSNSPLGWQVKFTEDKPLLTFVFRYRPIEILRANGIAPQDASPSSEGGNWVLFTQPFMAGKATPPINTSGLPTPQSEGTTPPTSTSDSGVEMNEPAKTRTISADASKPRNTRTNTEPSSMRSSRGGARAEPSSADQEKKCDGAVRLLDNPKASLGALAAANRFLEGYFMQGKRGNASFDERQRIYEAAEQVLVKENASDGAIAAANQFIEHYFL